MGNNESKDLEEEQIRKQTEQIEVENERIRLQNERIKTQTELLNEKTKLENQEKQVSIFNSEEKLQLARKENILYDGMIQVGQQIGNMKIREANLDLKLKNFIFDDERDRRYRQTKNMEEIHSAVIARHQTELSLLEKSETRQAQIHEKKMQEKILNLEELVKQGERVAELHQMRVNHEGQMNQLEVSRSQAGVQRVQTEVALMLHQQQNQDELHKVTLEQGKRMLHNLIEQDVRLKEEHDAKMEHQRGMNQIELSNAAFEAKCNRETQSLRVQEMKMQNVEKQAELKQKLTKIQHDQLGKGEKKNKGNSKKKGNKKKRGKKSSNKRDDSEESSDETESEDDLENLIEKLGLDPSGKIF